MRTAGTSVTPAASAAAVVRSSSSRTPRLAAALVTAVGCISQAAAAIRTWSASRQGVAAGERLAEGGLGEGDRPADPPGVGGHAHGQVAVERKRVGPAEGLESGGPGAALDLEAIDLLLVGAAVGLEGLGVREPAGEDRPPLARPGEDVEDSLGREVGLGAREVEVERGLDAGHPWISQPSASRAASITASASVGWPWTIRATSA